jgi:mannose-1-phosphate guanylyltransferase
MSELFNWAAILAGGEGTRLQAFTRLVTGDERPKQFCRLFGRDSLLGETRRRLCLNVEPRHTVCVVNKAHEPFYRHELGDMRRSHVIEQPSNRGTAAAVAATAVRLRPLAGECVVGFFPADQYCRDACAFRRTMAATFAAARADADRVFLIGAEATAPEVEYGWIQPGDRLAVPRVSATRRPVIRGVEAFFETPSTEAAADLLERRCLWNTFILVGTLGAFEALIEDALPDLWAALSPVRAARTVHEQPPILNAIFASVPRYGFSRDVLAARPERLGVIALPRAAWTDLGQPSRVLDALAHRAPRLRLAAG